MDPIVSLVINAVSANNDTREVETTHEAENPDNEP